MKFFIPFFIIQLCLAGQGDLFTQKELMELSKLKSKDYLGDKRGKELAEKGKYIFDLMLKRETNLMKKKLKKKDQAYFDKISEDKIYRDFIKDFVDTKN
jgi:hypothetical protein